MALYRRFVVVTMLFLITLSLIQPTFSRIYANSARKRGSLSVSIAGGRLSMEYMKVQHHQGIAEGGVVNSTTDRALSMLTHQQIQGENACQESGQSRSLGQRKLEPKFQCKRQIPGGPDPQHH